MITEKEYIKANFELEDLIKQLDSGVDVDNKLISVSKIIEEYEQTNFPIGMSS